jgi:tRNA-dihydrouridine synthase
MVEQAGAKALAVHCRTRDQGHRGNADWSWLGKIKDIVSIPIIGNGDVQTPEDVKRMFETGCDGVMIGRGAIQNPWIFQQAKHFLRTGEHLPEPSVGERIDTCLGHLRLVVQERGEQRGVIEFRKHYAGYLKGLRNASKVRAELMHFNEYEPVEQRLLAFADSYMSEAAA